MVALSALILADRGDLDLDAPVARYWPEFAAAGKDGVLVRHLLSHTAGLPDFDPPVMVGDLYDWPDATGRLAKQAPRWEPGTLAGYHSVTQGFLVGEVVRRVTGHSLAAFFADQVAGPLGADFHLTLPAEHDRRFAPGLPPPDAPDGDLTAAPPGSLEGTANLRAGTRGAVSRHRPGHGQFRALRNGLRDLRPRDRVGRLGRFDGHGRPGRQVVGCIRDEPDDTRRRLPRPRHR